MKRKITEAEIKRVYSVMVTLREQHPHGLRAIGSANAWEVLTRFGVSSIVALNVEDIISHLECEDDVFNPLEVVDLLRPAMSNPEAWEEPYPADVIAPGAAGDNGLFTHPNLLFTTANDNDRRYGIEADASISPGGGLSYYQDWRDKDEIIKSGVSVLSCWDAKEGRMLSCDEMGVLFYSQN